MNKISLMTLFSLSIILSCSYASALSRSEKKMIEDFVNTKLIPENIFGPVWDKLKELEVFSGKGHLKDLLIKVKTQQGDARAEKMMSFSLDVADLPKNARQNEVNLYKNIKASVDRYNEAMKKVRQKAQPIFISAITNAAQEPGFEMSRASFQMVLRSPEVIEAYNKIFVDHLPEVLNAGESLENIKNQLNSPKSSFEAIIKEKEIMD